MRSRCLAAAFPCRRRLGVKCSANLCTQDLETEIFLHILNNCVEYVEVRAARPASPQSLAVAPPRPRPALPSHTDSLSISLS